MLIRELTPEQLELFMQAVTTATARDREAAVEKLSHDWFTLATAYTGVFTTSDKYLRDDQIAELGEISVKLDALVKSIMESREAFRKGT